MTMSMPAPAFTSSVVERFLRYVTFSTQSDETSGTCPSTPGQMVLQHAIADELRQIGLLDVTVDSNGYLFATVPASPGCEHVPAIGFIAHVDTSPEMSGHDVKPILHRAWDGTDIRYPLHDSTLSKDTNPYLARHVGHDIITSSGDTLLGADNKAGVAEIVAAAELLVNNPDIPHGPIRIGFTPDEEIGRGADRFDVARFGAVAAYTMDGGQLAELEAESFSADSMTFTFQGRNSHPGYAHGVMVNAIKVAADFIARIPRELAPETTRDRAGFVHPYIVNAAVDCTRVKLLIRDFNTARLSEHEALLEQLAKQSVAAWPGASFTHEVQASYRNMHEILVDHPHIVSRAERAIERAGLNVIHTAIRGGTDGSRLSFMGLPTPNIFAGEQNIHSRHEWVSTYDMHKAVEVIVHLARIWAEEA